jgi:hypothetical protein
MNGQAAGGKETAAAQAHIERVAQRRGWREATLFEFQGGRVFLAFDVQRVPFRNVVKVHFHEKKISPSAGAVNAGEAAA